MAAELPVEGGAEVGDGVDLFTGPVCLIYTDDDGKLTIDDKVVAALNILNDTSPLVVLAIAGLYRTGKSYLMNRLAGKTAGFALGSTIVSKTKGIWIWVQNHPYKDNVYLVLLDTEGLGDVKKGNINHDNWIFTLATLLSSTLIYNAMSSITEDAITKLNFVTEMAKYIRSRTSDDKLDDADFDYFFPLFIFAIRDFSLQLEDEEGNEITADQYLEDSLQLRKVQRDEDKDYNVPRQCIRKYFKDRRCFTFDRPVRKRKDFKNLESLPDSQLSPDFVEDTQDFLDHIFKDSPVKKMSGRKMNIRQWVCLTMTYVDAIRQGVVPCVESAIKSVSEKENRRAMEGGQQVYETLMKDLQMPTKTDKEIIDQHNRALKKAVTYFLTRAILDEENEYQQRLNETIEDLCLTYITQNEEASMKKCKQVLTELSVDIKDKLENGTYHRSGGYGEFQDDLAMVQIKYLQYMGLGVKMDSAYVEFQQEMVTKGKDVQRADQRVTEDERKAEEQHQRFLIEEQQRLAAEREAELTREMLVEKERAVKENIEMLEKQYQKQIEDTKAHYDKILEARLKEQERLLKEGFETEADKLRDEMIKTRERYEKEKESWSGRIKDLVNYKSKAEKNYEEMEDKLHAFMVAKNEMEKEIKELKSKSHKSESDVSAMANLRKRLTALSNPNIASGSSWSKGASGGGKKKSKCTIL